MKKLLLTLCVAAMSGMALNAQIFFSEDFDNVGGPTAGGAGTYTFPAGWFLRNVDNRTPAAAVNYVNEAWERREDFANNVGDSCAFSTSWYNPAGAADDWMWTPLIGPLAPNTTLYWNAVTYDPMYLDGYEVRVMTAAQGPPTGGTGVIGNQVTNSTQVFSIAAENTTWTARSVSLAAYAGQSVYIAFRNTSNDKFLLLIDDILVEAPVLNDAQLTVLDTVTPYTIVPVDQTQPLNFSGDLRNNGSNPLLNVYVSVNVFDGLGNSVYTANSTAIPTLAASATAAWSITGYDPALVDYYSAEFVVHHSVVDPNTTNDTMFWGGYLVDDSTYARDDGTVIGALGIGVGNGYLGQEFLVANNDLLTSVGVYYTLGYTGRPFGLCIWDMSAGVPNQIIAFTDTLFYPDDSARYYTVPVHNGPLSLAPGSYVVTAIEFDSTVQVGLTNNIFTNNRTWFRYNALPWANNEDVGPQFAKSYVIRPNFGDVCLNNTATATSTQASCLTCADGTASVTTSGTTGALTYAWSPSGGNAATATGLLTGTYIVSVTDSFGCVVMDTVFVGYDVCGLIGGTTMSTDATCGTCPDGSAQIVVTGANGPLTYAWSNGGTSDTIQNVLPGTYTVTVTDSLGCTYTDSVVVNFSTDLAGINSPGAISLFPNPSNGVFQVNVSLAASADLTVFVTNTLGEVVATKTVNGIQNGRIDMNVDLAAGAYSLHVRSNDSEKIVPITIQK